MSYNRTKIQTHRDKVNCLMISGVNDLLKKCNLAENVKRKILKYFYDLAETHEAIDSAILDVLLDDEEDQEELRETTAIVINTIKNF